MANAAKVQVTGSHDGNAATAHVDTFARQHLPPRELWPDFVFTRPELRYPERLNCVSYFLDRWVEQGHGDAIQSRRIAQFRPREDKLWPEVRRRQMLPRERIDMGGRDVAVMRA